MTDWFTILSLICSGLTCLFLIMIVYFVAHIVDDILDELEKRDYQIREWIFSIDKEEIKEGAENEESLWDLMKKRK